MAASEALEGMNSHRSKAGSSKHKKSNPSGKKAEVKLIQADSPVFSNFVLD